MAFWPASAAAQAASEDTGSAVSASIELVSDYRFRGVSLSNRKPALQAGAEYSHSSGLFAGVWGSTLAETGGANAEVDVYVGYSGSAAGLSYTVTAAKYMYPGATGLAYLELQSEVEAPLGPVTALLEVAYTPEQKNAVANLYTAAGASYEGPHGTTVTAKLGRENGGYRRKWDLELGLSRSFGPVALRAAYVVTNHRSAQLGKDGKPTLLVGAGLEF
ncbi:MAG: TorF family putative porin [Sphingomicrobium sp.]